MTRLLEPLLLDLTRALVAADLGLGLEPSSVLFVVGAARLGARASIRGFGPEVAVAGPSNAGAWTRPEVWRGHQRVLYEVCLRPHFFRSLDARGRFGCVLHELWHVGGERAGRLDPRRSHRGAEGAWEPEVEALADRLLDTGGFSGWLEALEGSGEILVPAWLNRPPTRIPAASSARRRFDERDLYLQRVEWLSCRRSS